MRAVNARQMELWKYINPAAQVCEASFPAPKFSRKTHDHIQIKCMALKENLCSLCQVAHEYLQPLMRCSTSV